MGLARRSDRLVASAGVGMLIIGLLVGGSQDLSATEAGGDTPREGLVVQSATADSGTSFRVDRGGVGVLRVDEGPGLDSYVFRSGSPLSITLDTAPYGADQDRDVPTWGPVDEEGHPQSGHAFHNKVGRLTLRVLDVDDDYAGTQYAPEVDEVSVNGITLPGALSGADNQWSINTFEVPLDLVRFPTSDDPAGTNTIDIDIDTANTGADVWAVEASWVELRLDVDAVPLGVAHGLGDSANDMDFMATWFRENVQGLGDSEVFSLRHSPTGLIGENAETIGNDLAQLRSDTGASAANIVAHSKGGLDSRRYAFDNPDRVKSLVMLATPNGGSELAQDYCDSAMGGGTRFLGWIGRNVPFGAGAPTDCTSEDDATYQTTQTYVRDVFNQVVRDSPQVDYFTIAGQDSTLTAGWLNGEDDGAVTVESVRWLRFDRATDPGFHDYWPVGLPENHWELAGYSEVLRHDHTSHSWPIAACRMYGLRTAATCQGSDASSFSSASATSADLQSSAEVAVSTDLQVAAGTTASLPIDLESSAGAHVLILGRGVDQAGIEFAGAELATGRVLDTVAVGGSTSGQGVTDLVVTNPTVEEMDLGVLVWVETPRRVVVNRPAFAAPGEGITVTATVTEPDPSDALTLSVDGQRIPMTAQGDGQWSAEVTPSGAGHWHAVVHTGGSRPRQSSTTLSVLRDGAELVGSFSESVERSAAGRITKLSLAPDVATAAAGRWRVTLTLRGPDGRQITSATGVADLPAGGGPIPVSVTGEELHDGGVPGPWTIADVLLVEQTTDVFADHVAEMGDTDAYRLDELARDAVVISDTFTSEGVDSDGDGDFDRLDIKGEVTVEAATTYAVNGRLVATDGTELGEAASLLGLSAGTNDFTMSFDGAAIGQSGLDGPYRLVDLSVYAPADGESFDYIIEAHETGPYRSFEFEGGAVTLERLRTQLEAERAATRVSDGIARSLNAKLLSAESAFDRGNGGAGCNKLTAFLNELDAQRGVHVAAAAHDLLKPLAERLRDRRCSS